jgi:hypothetical protein
MSLRLCTAYDLDIVFCVAPATSFILNEEKRLKCNRGLLHEIALSIGPTEGLCADTVQQCFPTLGELPKIG